MLYSLNGCSQNMAYYTQVVPSSGDAQEKLAKIQRTHLGYLQLDENNEKLQKRRDLEDLISNHLSTVPHKEKFPCPKFLEVLRRSVDANSDLKANKASRAFDALEKYAVNLLCQPWRQEYRCIRLYSGFYQHHIDAHLSNAIEVLHLMGYENSSKMEVTLNEPIDPDKVIDVSLNCLIAAVECQIMMQVMEKTGGCYTLREVAYVRRHNMCDVMKTVSILVNNQKRSRNLDFHHHEKSAFLADSRIRAPHKSNGYVKVEKLVDVPCDWIDGVTDMMEADAMYPEISYASWASQKQARNGHNPESGLSKPQTMDEHIATAINRLNSIPKGQRLPYDPETRAESWGYVDQSLERKGYNKDYGERGDLLKTGHEITPIGRAGFDTKKLASRLPNYAPLQPSAIHGRPPCQFITPNAPAKSKLDSDLFLQPYNQSQLAFAENEMRRQPYSSYLNAPGMSHRFPTENLINLEQPYVDLYFPGGYLCPYPKIVAGHVCRTNVPYVHNTHAHPVHAAAPVLPTTIPVDPHPARSLPPLNRGTRQGAAINMESLTNSMQALDIGNHKESEKVSGKKPAPSENRRSWYDNVGAGNDEAGLHCAVDRPLVGSAGMPPADQVMAHLCEPIMLPPPTPFQTELPPIVPEAAPSRPAASTHRRRASDGVTDIAIADGAPRVSTLTEKFEKSNNSDGVTSSRKSSSSSVERRPTPSRDDKPVKDATQPTARRGSSLLRHERSPSAGSIRSGTYSTSGASTQSKWNCWACTFLNRPEREICEMCSRSRNRGAESSPLTSGGHECQQCTLVNEKGAVKCVACGLSLENSPTYV